uniref:Aegyptin/gSG7 salivary protein-like four-helix bundle domain-containing protein n=1 Tax=Anopheles quadriannulatus TaxID=34691 RepID=A0A1I8JWB1_ANOQN
MTIKLCWVFAALGLIWLLQISPCDASPRHAKQLISYFKRMKLDQTKNRVYQHDVKNGLRVHLRGPLLQKALCLPKGTKLSSDCLNRMVDKARQHENKFYAKFTYACKTNAEYSAKCLDSGRPVYYRALKQLAKETERCWKL